MMKYLQKLGKALMLPVAALPVAGILMGVGYLLAPGVMGVPGAETAGAAYTVGFLLVKAGGALIDNMAWLFAIGAAVGLSDDHDGTAGLAGLVAFLMIQQLLSPAVVATVRGIGAGIYAFLNRLLIPTGLHHALNNVFWFDTIGLGDLSHFWAGDVMGQNGANWSVGMYMSGFFPCMMFGIPGAALAMVKAAKNKKAAIGLVLSAAICAFVCGVTEPFEFGFMFLCFPLYVVYAALYGIFTVIVYYVNFRAGFCFSAGATDLLFSASLPAASNTWMIIPLGIAAFVIFYAVFYFAITKFDLKTPGREDDVESDGSAAIAAASSDDKYAAIAAGVLAAVGGKENIKNYDFCATRLRFEVVDSSKVDEAACKAAGAVGVIRPSAESAQVIIGTQVQAVYDELKKLA